MDGIRTRLLPISTYLGRSANMSYQGDARLSGLSRLFCILLDSRRSRATVLCVCLRASFSGVVAIPLFSLTEKLARAWICTTHDNMVHTWYCRNKLLLDFCIFIY